MTQYNCLCRAVFRARTIVQGGGGTIIIQNRTVADISHNLQLSDFNDFSMAYKYAVGLIKKKIDNRYNNLRN